MLFLTLTAPLALAAMVSAIPFEKRQALNDGVILNYALTLEYLEAQFYKEALANYTEADFDAANFTGVRNDIVEIGAQEEAHAVFLSTALMAAGITPTSPCNYSFPATDVTSFLALAQVIEGVGVSAYLGAAASISTKEYLTAAGAILTIEARHNTYLIGSNKGNPVPAAFDTPLDFDEVFTIASAFIVSCPMTNPALPVKAFPSLTVVGPTTVSANETITVGGEWTNGIYAVVISGLATYPVQVENNAFMFPSDPSISGQVYLVFSTSANVTDSSIIAGPAILNAM